VALRSLLSGGIVAVAAPPDKRHLLLHAQAESVSADAVIAIQPPKKAGTLTSIGLGGYLNLCQLEEGGSSATKALALCAGAPTTMEQAVALPIGKPHHRQLLMSKRATAEFVIEYV